VSVNDSFEVIRVGLEGDCEGVSGGDNMIVEFLSLSSSEVLSILELLCHGGSEAGLSISDGLIDGSLFLLEESEEVVSVV
jgi:hypothetical protein